MGNSITSEYRNTIDREALKYNELIDHGYDDCKEFLIPETAVKGVLDTVEDNVNEIVNLLEDIEGLSEIDTVKTKLKELSYKLY